MKKVHNFLRWTILGFLALVFSPLVNAQDDLYYDPSTDTPKSPPATYTEDYDENNNVTRRYNDDDEYYDDDDDYAYEYSSRVRRFHRHSAVVDYYDPFFVDLYNYDPFYSPGTSIYVYNYNDYWSYRRWRHWNRWNSWNAYDYGWGSGWNSWGWQSSYAYNSPWYNPWVVNNYYYDPYWTCNGYNPYYQNQYYGNGWVNNHYYYNNDNGGNGYSPKTYTGPRRGGSHVNPGYARISDSKGRLATSQANVPTIEKTASSWPGRTAGDYEGNTAVGRGKSAADRSATPNTGGRKVEGPATQPTGRRVEKKPSPINEESYKPRRSEEVKSTRKEIPATRTEESNKSRRTDETPTRRNNHENGTITPRRSEPAPTRSEESRPARRAEERSIERPNRSNNGGGSGNSSQESRPTRSSEGVSNSRSSSNGSSSRSSDSGSSKSSNSGSTKSSSSGRGGRN